ncbi:MAG: D-aminoacylase [Syntrophus sp. SKADARSKE-3]|nr:D-aminoacylase [Syntrophus sp. SKADARSKE-3]
MKNHPYDLLIVGGVVYNGLGTAGVEADVAIKDDRFVRIEPAIDPKSARRVIDASCLAVAPGFIDPHSHTDIELLVNPKAESKIRQGVTTEIAGNCGFTYFPLSRKAFEEKKATAKKVYDLDMDWRDLRGFLDRLQRQGIALNYGTFLGHGVLRESVIGMEDRTSESHEIEAMQAIVEENMKAGAFGLSTGLIYSPGNFAQTEEIEALCRIVKKYGGIYTTHMRDEGDYLIESVEETIRVARETGVSLQISHLKLAYPRNWSKIHLVLSRISQVRSEGIDIMADRYPYTATSTFLSVFFPRWIKNGNITENLKKLTGTSQEKQLRDYIRVQEEKIGSWDNILIASLLTETNQRLAGKTIRQAADESGKDPYSFIRDLIIEENDQVGMINFSLNEETFKRIIMHPLVVIGSDGWALAPYGRLAKDKPHPRSYGTFPRMLGRYVRDEKILSLGRAIEKMTSLTTEKFGLAGRGRIQKGYFADIVIFNPDTVIDVSTWQEPHRYPVGIPYVIVNGQLVIENGEHTGRLPGRILRHEPRSLNL